ncbi:unnamed protein product (macronuclear) [Paramecium tetraurelia]|uniref:Deoxyribodipyrimidine photo-lyase n=1 Tax=Paramecium tetraurelia TaxID=5888 RepID=A0E5N7_PARTE|nr:uncharacterized protein GSPATT00003465001 [Paramecium tetraurelia]CAK90604.1 unnamed protein product [Paramecium tetraurelia]|eukprot:XP_001458001.1 hypothetical protein (macronuclear) [Paramecium tetraurelia strain d4-2]
MKERIKYLNDKKVNVKGKYVAYWIQASQRTKYNHALELAIQKANQEQIPLFCFFGLTKYPAANQRPYHFMLEGLQQLKTSLADRKILFGVAKQSPDDLAISIAQNAKLLIVDCGYLRIQKQWRKKVADTIDCQFIQVETDVLVPVEQASQKEEWAAKTIRPKIQSLTKYFAKELNEETLVKQMDKLPFQEYDISNITKVIDDLGVDKSVSIVQQFKGGEIEAQKRLEEFLNKKLKNYAKNRNDPSLNATSNLSPYLHFGMISPLHIYLEAMKFPPSESRESFLEELIVRRELSMNFCYYNDLYDKYEGLPDWAKNTLQEHAKDKRDYIYTLDQLEKAKTHDVYWNSAQLEAIHKGKISGYMRMYWGKKVIEWTESPQQAFEYLVFLNDKYHLDGRDANGYTGVAWCFGKHDRPWTGRKIFGNIRYMIDSGLKRKFDTGQYVMNVNQLKKQSLK